MGIAELSGRIRVAVGPLGLGLLLATAQVPGALADAADAQREQSNLSVMGVDELSSPTHRETFSMIDYTPDPIEGFNRGSLAFTKPIIHWGVRPLAKGWRFITPTPVRESLDNTYYNLGFPGRFLSLLLQAELVKAAKETGHFLVNSTIGLAGLFDPASRFGIPTHREDMGLTFARWGSGPGFYLFLPLFGPSSGRDALGRIFDTALHPTTYIPGSGLFFNINAFSSRIDGYETLEAAYDDLYLPVRALWGTQRHIAAERYAIPPEAYTESDPDPSLGTLLFKPKDPEFFASGAERAVAIASTGRELPYSVWVHEKPAPFVVIIPGIGSHRSASTPVALAELAYNHGYSVVVVSSPFHREFLQNGLSSPYPGFTPDDAEDLYAAFEAIRDDIDDVYGPIVSSVQLMGYSLGAIETLFVAAAQSGRPKDAIPFDRFVAINPPVNLRYALRQFDGFFDIPLKWPESERNQRVKETAMKAFLVLRGEGKEQEARLPFTREESQFLIGFMGRTMMMDTLAAIEERGGGRLQLQKQPNRGPLVSRINQSSFARYAEELIIPHLLTKHGSGASNESLVEAASLTSLTGALAENDRIRILTNANDFILSEDDLRWLQQNLGSRVTVFPDGGHLGNLYLPAVQTVVLEALGKAD